MRTRAERLDAVDRDVDGPSCEDIDRIIEETTMTNDHLHEQLALATERCGMLAKERDAAIARAETAERERDDNAKVILATRQLSIDAMNHIRAIMGVSDYAPQPAAYYVQELVAERDALRQRVEALEKGLGDCVPALKQWGPFGRLLPRIIAILTPPPAPTPDSVSIGSESVVRCKYPNCPHPAVTRLDHGFCEECSAIHGE